MLKKISSLNPRGHVNEHMFQGLYMTVAIISRYRLICCINEQDPPPPLLQCSVYLQRGKSGVFVKPNLQESNVLESSKQSWRFSMEIL